MKTKNIKSTSEKPFVSLVVTTYNSENNIKEALNSLVKQDYPKNKYEIIVVDDASSDKTCEIVSEYPVDLIKKKNNNGISKSRNIGLEKAKGEIYINFDDDCVANKNWLKNLVSVYEENFSIQGVCGICTAYDKSKICSRFLEELGEGNPYFIDNMKNSNFLSRFIYYLKRKYKGPMNSKTKYVYSMPGANASFKIKTLKEIKGWEEDYRLSQDSDICKRIFNKYPNPFICNKSAVLKHKHPSNFFFQLKRKFKRGENTLIFYKKEKLSLPIFPFPIAIIGLTLASLIFNPLLGLASIILLPHLFYFWYNLKFLKTFNTDYLIFPHMNFLWELAEVLGIIKAKLNIKNRK